MLQSLKYSQLFLRLGLAAVFLWFGIDKFVHPQYWVEAWLPQSVIALLQHIKVSGKDFIFFQGIVETFIGIGLVTNIFMRFFSFIACVLLICIMIMQGFNEVLVRDLGLLGGFMALIVWPERRSW